MKRLHRLLFSSALIASQGFIAVRVLSAQGGSNLDSPRRSAGAVNSERVVVDGKGGLLGSPAGMAADSAMVCISDFADYQIKCFDYAGKAIFYAGRKGAAPGEFRALNDLHLTADGRIAVYDTELGRVTRFGRRGVLAGTTKLPFPVTSVRGIAGGGWSVVPVFGDDLLVELDSAGRRVRAVSVPPELKGRNPIEMQRKLLSLGGGDYVLTSTVTDRFFVASGSQAVLSVRGIDPVEFPRFEKVSYRRPDGTTETGYRPARDVVPTTIGSAVSGRQLYLLNWRASRLGQRVIDVFNLPAGSYAGSFVLPRAAVAIALPRPDHLVAIVTDPEPQIVEWRLVRR